MLNRFLNEDRPLNCTISGGSEFQIVTILTLKKCLRAFTSPRRLNSLYGCPLVEKDGLTVKKSSNLKSMTPKTIS